MSGHRLVCPARIETTRRWRESPEHEWIDDTFAGPCGFATELRDGVLRCSLGHATTELRDLLLGARDDDAGSFQAGGERWEP